MDGFLTSFLLLHFSSMRWCRWHLYMKFGGRMWNVTEVEYSMIMNEWIFTVELRGSFHRRLLWLWNRLELKFQLVDRAYNFQLLSTGVGLKPARRLFPTKANWICLQTLRLCDTPIHYYSVFYILFAIEQSLICIILGSCICLFIWKIIFSFFRHISLKVVRCSGWIWNLIRVLLKL